MVKLLWVLRIFLDILMYDCQQSDLLFIDKIYDELSEFFKIL